MKQKSQDPRRDFLLYALSVGLYSSVAGNIVMPAALAMGDIPAKLPAGRSIYKLKGRVSVDGALARLDTPVKADSLVKTGDDSRIIFVVGGDAFILRSNSEIQLGGEGLLLSGLRIISGKLLSVFGRRTQAFRVRTPTATIGIRGTGLYVEAEPDQSYVCTCYGHTLIGASDDLNQQQEVISKHHDQPLYILPKSAGKLIRPAPFINHTDVELALIEELVGRSVPFAFSGGAYDKPRKRSY